MSAEEEFEIGLLQKLYNASLRGRRESLGKTGKQVATEIGISSASIYQYESFRQYPSHKMAEKLATYFGCSIGEIFPEWLKKCKPVKFYNTIPINKLISYNKQALIDDGGIEELEKTVFLKDSLAKILTTLTKREEKIIRLRFGFDDDRARTLDEVATEFNVTRERIRQIEAKALRKLRHPSRSRKLRDYL